MYKIKFANTLGYWAIEVLLFKAYYIWEMYDYVIN